MKPARLYRHLAVAIKPCVCKPVGFPEANVNPTETPAGVKLRPIAYWWLWVLDTVLVSAGLLFFLALQYGTYEFFGRACMMALLPLIPVMVLVGGAGSTIFALTKVWIEKRAWPRPQAVALLVGPALAVTLALGLLGAGKSPGHRLNFICLGNAPASVSHVRISGYSTFLRGEWLAVFTVGPKDFQTLVAGAKLVPADAFEFQLRLDRSAQNGTRLFQSLPPLKNLPCFRRDFKESEEHQRGGVYAVFDPVTSTAAVFREYND
jgi:hypothetical protein